MFRNRRNGRSNEKICFISVISESLVELSDSLAEELENIMVLIWSAPFAPCSFVGFMLPGLIIARYIF